MDLHYLDSYTLLTGLIGGMGREDDDVKVDNVICRTPARNAQNLELVKTEILDMVDRAVSNSHDRTNEEQRARS